MATIIDADGHIVEPRAVWEEYTESAYREGVIQIARDSEGIDCLRINGEIRRDRNMAIAAACTPGGLSDPHKARTMSWDELFLVAGMTRMHAPKIWTSKVSTSPFSIQVCGSSTATSMIPSSRRLRVVHTITGWPISANPTRTVFSVLPRSRSKMSMKQ